MNESNVILTGLPRSGTTLTCHLLNTLPDTVALHEPMQGRHVAGDVDDEERCRTIERFFAEQRASILAHGRAASRTFNGVIPDNPFGDALTDAGWRRHLDAKGEIAVDRELNPDFMLVVKHIASFTAMLAALVQRFRVYAVIRNPLAVLGSWSTLDAPLREGHVGPAERLDADLRAKLATYGDPIDRQIHLLGWFFEQFHRHLPASTVITYEALVESGGQVLSVIHPGARDFREPFENRNANLLYDRDYMLRAGDRLLATEGAYWAWYSRDSVRNLLGELAETRRG